MPAEWTGDFIGRVHLANITLKAVAEEAKLDDKYVSQVLHSENPSPKAKEKLYAALGRLTKEA